MMMARVVRVHRQRAAVRLRVHLAAERVAMRGCCCCCGRCGRVWMLRRRLQSRQRRHTQRRRRGEGSRRRGRRGRRGGRASGGSNGGGGGGGGESSASSDSRTGGGSGGCSGRIGARTHRDRLSQQSREPVRRFRMQRGAAAARRAGQEDERRYCDRRREEEGNSGTVQRAGRGVRSRRGPRARPSAAIAVIRGLRVCGRRRGCAVHGSQGSDMQHHCSLAAPPPPRTQTRWPSARASSVTHSALAISTRLQP